MKQSVRAQHLVNSSVTTVRELTCSRLTELVGGYPVNSIAAVIIWLSVSQVRSLKFL